LFNLCSKPLARTFSHYYRTVISFIIFFPQAFQESETNSSWHGMMNTSIIFFLAVKVYLWGVIPFPLPNIFHRKVSWIIKKTLLINLSHCPIQTKIETHIRILLVPRAILLFTRFSLCCDSDSHNFLRKSEA